MSNRVRVTARELAESLRDLEELAEQIGSDVIGVRSKTGKAYRLKDCALMDRRRLVRKTLAARFLLRKLLYHSTLDVDREGPASIDPEKHEADKSREGQS